MADAEGPGKTPKIRKHQPARIPYARPTPGSITHTDVTPNGRGLEAPGTDGKASLFGSVLHAAKTPLRAAAGLITKVRSGTIIEGYVHIYVSGGS